MERTDAMAVATTKSDVKSLANQYLTNVLGPDYQVADGFWGNGCWHFRIVYHCPKLQQALGVGKLLVDANTGAVIPLTQEQIEDAHEQVSEQQGEVNGISRQTARHQMQGYLTNEVSLFAEPDRPLYCDGNPPLWRATVFLRIRGQGSICELGTLDVNVNTGAVLPLSNRQLQRMRDQVQNAIGRATLATATAR